MDIRQPLQSPEWRGLVRYEEAHTKVGRSTGYWLLIQQDDAQFADRYARLSATLRRAVQACLVLKA